MKTYHREQGVQGEEFSSGAFLRLRDGRVCFGGPGGFNIFDPQRLTHNQTPPRLALTRIEVLGVRPRGRRRSGAATRSTSTIAAASFRSTLACSISARRSITSSPIACRGSPDQWIDLGSPRRITLTNLDAGDHVLEVRAANADSVWSEAPVRVSIHRDPAPWRSPFAYAAYAVLVLGFILYRVHRQRVKFMRSGAGARSPRVRSAAAHA